MLHMCCLSSMWGKNANYCEEQDKKLRILRIPHPIKPHSKHLCQPHSANTGQREAEPHASNKEAQGLQGMASHGHLAHLSSPAIENPTLGSSQRVLLTIVPSVVPMYCAFTTISESEFLTERQEFT